MNLFATVRCNGKGLSPYTEKQSGSKSKLSLKLNINCRLTPRYERTSECGGRLMERLTKNRQNECQQPLAHLLCWQAVWLGLRALPSQSMLDPARIAKVARDRNMAFPFEINFLKSNSSAEQQLVDQQRTAENEKHKS